jgi:hypothetical protein
MERENEVGAAGNPVHGPGVPGRTLYPLKLLRLTSASAANEQEPSWIDVDLAGSDAPISVWWDYPPCADPL